MTRGKVSNASTVDILRYHHSLLSDTTRTSAYESAIRATVRPNDVVLDLGCGSGILSFFACRAGARRVYAIDELPVIELARTLARENGFADRIVFLNTHSTEAVIGERVDVIVTETMGNNGFDEQLTSAAAHARRAWLREGGVIVPRAVALRAAPAEMAAVHASNRLWQMRPYGFDFSSVAAHAMNAFFPIDIAPEQLLSGGATLARVLIGEDVPSIRGMHEFAIERDATLHGIAVWFRAELTADVAITNEPPNPCPSWKQSFFPVAEPLEVRRDDVVRIEIRTFGGVEWQWTVEHRGVARAQQSTFFGFPFNRGA